MLTRILTAAAFSGALAVRAYVAAQQFPELPPQGAIRLTQEGAWRNVLVSVVTPDGPEVTSTIPEVFAKWAEFRVPSERRSYALVVFLDAQTRKTNVMPRPPGLGFYVTGDAGVLAFHLSSVGDLQWAGSYLEIPEGDLNLDAAAEHFQTAFDEAAVIRHLARTTSINLAAAAGPGVFRGPMSAYETLEIRTKVTGALLYLEVLNTTTTKTANFWVDLKTSRIVRSIDSSGRERRNVSTAKPWLEMKSMLIDSSSRPTRSTSKPTEIKVSVAHFSILGTNINIEIAAIPNERSSRTTFVPWSQFYVSLGNRIRGVSVTSANVMLREQLATTTGTGTDPLARWSQTANLPSLRGLLDDRTFIQFREAVGPQFAGVGSMGNSPRVDQSSLTGGILRLAMSHPDSRQSAICWFDIRPGRDSLQRVVRPEQEGAALYVPLP